MKIIRRLSALLVSVVMLLSVLPQIPVTAAVAFAGGSGTLVDPYQVSTPEQLNEIRYNLDKHFVLMNDINLSSFNGGEWLPIGDNSTNSEESRFTGSFDGNGKVIQNLSSAPAASSYVGLFGYIQNASVKDLGLENLIINFTSSSADGHNFVGGICGYNDNGSIINSYNTGSMFVENRSRLYIGGISGLNYGIIDNCYNTASINAFISMGIYAGNVHNLLAGGITGSNSGKITNSYNKGDITGTSDLGKGVHVAGISATNGNDASTTIIENCYNIGNLNCYAPNTHASVSGITYSGGDSVSNCYNAGNLYVEGAPYDGSVWTYRYGISGGNPTNSYCINLYDSTHGEAKTLSEMKSAEFVDLLNANAGTNRRWIMDSNNENNGYPLFDKNTPSAVTSSHPSGGVDWGTEIVLSTTPIDANIYYTLDGRTPTITDTLYTSPIVINDDTAIKAVAIKGGIPSSVVSNFEYFPGGSIYAPYDLSRGQWLQSPSWRFVYNSVDLFKFLAVQSTIDTDIYAIIKDASNKIVDAQKFHIDNPIQGNNWQMDFDFNKPAQAKYIEFYCYGYNAHSPQIAEYLLARYSVNSPQVSEFFNSDTSLPYASDNQIYTIKGQNSLLSEKVGTLIVYKNNDISPENIEYMEMKEFDASGNYDFSFRTKESLAELGGEFKCVLQIEGDGKEDRERRIINLNNLKAETITYTEITPPYSATSALSASDGISRKRTYGKGYSFSANAGQTVTVTMDSSALDSYLYLLDESYNVLTEDDDGGGGLNSKITYTFDSSGTYYIQATEASAKEGAFSLNVTLSTSVINVTGMTLNKSSMALEVGQPDVLIPTITPSNATNKTVLYSSSNADIASVGADGKVIANAVGSAVITATTQNGNISKTCSVTVSNAKTIPSVTTSDVEVGTITQNSAKLLGAVSDNGGSAVDSVGFIYYAKSNPSVKYTINATTSDFSKIITGLTADTEYCYYAFATNEIGTGYGLEKSFKTLAAAKPVPNSISLNQSYIQLSKDGSKTLIATVLPENAENRNVIWTSDNTQIATVTQGGAIKAIAQGKTKIRATTEVGRLEAVCDIDVIGGTISGIYDFSELNMAAATNNTLNPGKGFTVPLSYGSTPLDTGGNATMSGAYLASWAGAVVEDRDPYPTSNNQIQYNELASDYHLQDYVKIPARSSSTDNDEIKTAIMKYGAMYSSYYHSDSYYSGSKAAYYCPTNRNTNHAISIVGWDDNFSKSNFSSVPPGDGAFICRNSWSSGWGEGGYFYISYYDPNIGGYNTVFTNMESNTNYNKIYQYDPFGYISSLPEYNEIFGANVFTSGNTAETLEAVSFYTTEKNVNYEIYVIPQFNGINSFSSLGAVKKKDKMIEAGYHTVQLDAPISLKAKTKFAVIVKLISKDNNVRLALEAPYSGFTENARANTGESFYSSNGNTWYDIAKTYTNYNVCIKAFTNMPTSRTGVLFAAVDNENRLYESDVVHSLEDWQKQMQMPLNPEFIEYIESVNEPKMDAFGVDDDNPTGAIPPPFVFENNGDNITVGAVLPTRYDLRDEQGVTPVKNQGSYGTCWTFATYSSVESCLLRKMNITGGNWLTVGSGAPVAVSNISLGKTFLPMAIGGTVVFNATVLPENATNKAVLYTSSDDSVVMIDASGKATALKSGNATITAKNLDGTVTATCNIAVSVPLPVSGVYFGQTQLNMQANDVLLLNYSVYPENRGLA